DAGVSDTARRKPARSSRSRHRFLLRHSLCSATRPLAVSALPASVLTDRAMTCQAANRPQPKPEPVMAVPFPVVSLPSHSASRAMVALLLYGYCQGERSSRVIEKRCLRDVAYRVIAGGLYPDHATIARFRTRHEKALGGLFSQVLRLLAAEGMVSLGLLSLDGTKLAGNAAQKAGKTLPQIEKLLAEATEVDAAEDAQKGGNPQPAPPRAVARRA